MGNVNKVFLLGRLTHDPELRFTPQGTAVCDLDLAVNRVSKAPDGSQREETCFVRVTAWQRQAEIAAEYLKKGREVHVEGRLTLDQWEDKKSGEKRSRLKVTAERIQFIGGKNGVPAPEGDKAEADAEVGASEAES